MAWEEEEKKQESVSDGSETPTSEAAEETGAHLSRPGDRAVQVQGTRTCKPATWADLACWPCPPAPVGALALDVTATGVALASGPSRQQPITALPSQGNTTHPPALPPAGLPRHAGPKTPPLQPLQSEVVLHPDKSQQPWSSRRHPCSPATKPTPSPIAPSVSPPASPFSRLARGPSSLSRRRPWVRKRESRCHVTAFQADPSMGK
jgi:hypothetical protein